MTDDPKPRSPRRHSHLKLVAVGFLLGGVCFGVAAMLVGHEPRGNERRTWLIVMACVNITLGNVMAWRFRKLSAQQSALPQDPPRTVEH